MKLYQKIIEGSKTHVYILGFPVYYENIKDNETRKRFLWMHSVKKREVGIVQNGDKKSIFSKIINTIESDVKNNTSYSMNLTSRKSVEEMFEIVKNFDVISFDIFDTALLRKVEFPSDIFDIMALEMHWPDFTSARKRAEDYARVQKEKTEGHREVTIDEIYGVLRERYNIEMIWMQREIELEKQSSIQNSYIFALYERLIHAGKTVVFTTDMYLPKDTLKEMLESSGYHDFCDIYVSNVYQLRKGDGSLQKKLIEKYPLKKIIHIGDNKTADVDKSEKSGMAALWYPDCRLQKREVFLNNLSGSIYRAIVNNTLNTGLWEHGLHYTHGFRVGGILTAGYCEHINEVAQQKGAEKILFCARDCYIIQKVYNAFYRKVDNSYIEISRYAVMNLSPERYANDILDRFIFRYWDENKNAKTLEQLLHDTGYNFLVPYLEDNDLDRFIYCSSASKELFAEFFLSHIDVLKENSKVSREAATAYFGGLIGTAKSILIVDVGWSGTCISALEYFIHDAISPDIHVSGTLVCSSNTKNMCNQILGKYIVPYVCGPCRNNDFNNFMMPSGKKSVREIDMLHMPLEYMFTADTASLVEYFKDNDATVNFVRDVNTPKNINEIREMQNGIYAFNEKYVEYTKHLLIDVTVSPYVAFIALKESITDKNYSYSIYKNFLYDACTAPGNAQRRGVPFSSFFPDKITPAIISPGKGKRILFVSPALIYTGAPRSLLRVCRLARELGYEPIVWSAKDGPFREEFLKENIALQIVQAQDISQNQYMDIVSSCELAYCNTIVTDDYVRILSRYLPTVWFIREATNIPDFCRNKPERLALLQSYDKIFCVSEYAATALSQYTNQQIHIIHNCVEDESQWAENYRPGSGPTVKFVQFGTMEYRKGYDILIAAYKSMPIEYQRLCEMYFAGGFINSGTPYCDYLFSEMDNVPSLHYLGIIEGAENKIRTLSQMDVVVVASRDESCSLVALEGAMLSKPLILTESVGAKYIVDSENGLIVTSGDVEAMKKALMQMIDNKNALHVMGIASRKIYESRAGMSIHKAAFERLFNELSAKGKDGAKLAVISDFDETEVVISLTSHPGRMACIHTCLESLIKQDYRNRKIILWLSLEQFVHKEKDLPAALLNLNGQNAFEIRWVADDIKPHKKYYYAYQEFRKTPIIVVDDDVVYDPSMVRALVASYKKHPHCISCHRANLMLLRADKTFRAYQTWPMGYTLLSDTPSYQLLPTGVGGVLYPPNSLPEYTFNTDVIKRYCLLCDDLWLKMMTVLNEYPTVVVKNHRPYKLIDGSQDVALWKENVKGSNNDITLHAICEYIYKSIPQGSVCMERIRKDRFC